MHYALFRTFAAAIRKIRCIRNDAVRSDEDGLRCTDVMAQNNSSTKKLCI